jgi:ABC-type antimicrobial peptide transport system permease subunit
VENVVYADYYYCNPYDYQNNVVYDKEEGEEEEVQSYITIDGVKKPLSDLAETNSYNNDSNSAVSNTSVKVIDLERSDGKIYPNGIADDLEKDGKQIWAAGGSFSESSKGEVILSEILLKKFGLSPTEAIGKSLTYQISGTVRIKRSDDSGDNYGTYLDGDANANNGLTSFSTDDLSNSYSSEVAISATVLSEFKIVGVISSDYFNAGSWQKAEPQIWISDASAYTRKGDSVTTAYFPTVKNYTDEDENGSSNSYQVITYSQVGATGIATLSEQAAEEKMFFPAFPLLNIATMTNSYMDTLTAEYPVTTMAIQCKNYQKATDIVGYIDTLYSNLSGEESDAFYSYASNTCASELFSNFTMLNQVGGYVMVIMYTFGGIIFFATLLNLYNSVNYSVQSRRNYMGMMRAIGAKDNVIPRMYFIEILLIFARSTVWVLLFGGGISYGIKALIDMVFQQEEAAALLAGGISLNFAYFFVALAAVVVFVFLIAFLFSRVACNSVTHKGILEVLTDDK